MEYLGQKELFAALSVLIVSLILTPLFRKLAVKLRIFAAPNHRTIHKQAIPKLGGLSIFFAFTVGVLFTGWLSGGIGDYYILLISATIVASVGFFDDMYGLSCYRKLAFEILAAAVVVYSGFRVDTIYFQNGESFELGLLSFPLSLLWIVGVANAVNLLDGLDGLAAGFAIFVGIVVLIVSGMSQNAEIVTLAVIYIAATIGFLKYNYPPAKLFMGDTGSLFLGFCLACISLKAFTTSTAGTNVVAIMVAFALPLIDTFLAILRRVYQGLHPFHADNKHIHHRLLEYGLSKLSALFVIYAVTIVTGVLAIVLCFVNVQHASFILLALLSVALLMLYNLGCFDFIARKHRSKKLLNRNELLHQTHSSPNEVVR